MIDDDFFPRDPWTVLREGAAADCADPTDIPTLPRLVRYALIVGNPDAKPRIAAEIAEVSAVLRPGASAWADSSEHVGWVDLAGGLDAAAVEADRPTLRSLADAVRIASMTVTDVAASPADGLRVMAAIRTAMAACADLDVGTPQILCALETMVIGWSYIVAGDVERWTLKKTLAHNEARALGHRMTRHTRVLMEEKASERRSREAQAAAGTARPAASTGKPVTVPEGHVLVCPPIDSKSNAKLRDAIKGHEHVVGAALRLATMPDVASVRRELVAEFPYAVDTVDALVRPLVGAHNRIFSASRHRGSPRLRQEPPGAAACRGPRRGGLADRRFEFRRRVLRRPGAEMVFGGAGPPVPRGLEVQGRQPPRADRRDREGAYPSGLREALGRDAGATGTRDSLALPGSVPAGRRGPALRLVRSDCELAAAVAVSAPRPL